jgi:hypothetical protein
MRRKLLATIASMTIAGTIALVWAPWASSAPSSTSACGTTYAPVLDPANFVAVIDNPYFPLPVGRTLVYRGVRDGQTQTDTVTVTDRKKSILGIQTTVVNDVATHGSTLLEKTFDYYAQDDQGNVWYLGEDTTHFLPNGKADTSGSFQAGIGGAQPGIIMEANPQIPDAYRQECFAGQAEDTAWVVGTEGSSRVPYGNVRNVLTTLEATRIEAGAYDEKIYGPGIGIVSERSLTGPAEFAQRASLNGSVIVPSRVPLPPNPARPLVRVSPLDVDTFISLSQGSHRSPSTLAVRSKEVNGMKITKTITVTVASLVLAGATLGGVALASSDGTGKTVAGPTASSAESSVTETGSAAVEDSATDGDDVQEGDQTGPEVPDANEGSGAESEGTGSDGPGGHEDPPGNVDHQFEGEE